MTSTIFEKWVKKLDLQMRKRQKNCPGARQLHSPSQCEWSNEHYARISAS